MLDQDRVSGCGGSERSEESDLFLLSFGGPSISCEALPLAEELRDSFSLSWHLDLIWATRSGGVSGPVC